jgi:hypothetical protein
MVPRFPRPGLPAPPPALTLVLAVALHGGAALPLATLALAALALRQLLAKLDVARPERIAALALLVPAGFLTSATVTVAAAALLMALAEAIGRRHRAMLGWCGIAAGLSLAAATVLPFFLALLIARRVAVRDWAVAPLAAGATLVAAGWFAPAAVSPLPAPGLWSLAPLPLALAGVAIVAGIGAVAGYAAQLTVTPLRDRQIALAAAIAALIPMTLLPGFDLTAFAIPALLALPALAGDRRERSVALLVQIGALTGVAGAALTSAATLFACAWGARMLLRRAANDNPVLERWPADSRLPQNPVYAIVKQSRNAGSGEYFYVQQQQPIA